MDNTDIKILNCLRENSRINASQIGEQINMSVSAVIERMKRLESTGIIKRYTTILDCNMIGKDTTAFISISLEHPKHIDNFIKNITSNDEITECHFITGDFDFILKVVTHSTQTLERVLNEIKSIKGVSLTKTLVVLSTSKQEASPPLESLTDESKA